MSNISSFSIFCFLFSFSTYCTGDISNSYKEIENAKIWNYPKSINPISLPCHTNYMFRVTCLNPFTFISYASFYYNLFIWKFTNIVQLSFFHSRHNILGIKPFYSEMPCWQNILLFRRRLYDLFFGPIFLFPC